MVKKDNLNEIESLIFRSDADYLVLAGDFNVDPRDGEVLISQIKSILSLRLGFAN